jgi:hypothetical protein
MFDASATDQPSPGRRAAVTEPGLDRSPSWTVIQALNLGLGNLLSDSIQGMEWCANALSASRVEVLNQAKRQGEQSEQLDRIKCLAPSEASAVPIMAAVPTARTTSPRISRDGIRALIAARLFARQH